MSSEREVMRQHHSKVGRFFRNLVNHECKHVRRYREQSDSELEIASISSHGQQGQSFHAQHTVPIDKAKKSSIDQRTDAAVNRGKKSTIDVDEQKDPASDNGKDTFSVGGPEQANLWDQAYEKLRNEEQDLVNKFQEVVEEQAQKLPSQTNKAHQDEQNILSTDWRSQLKLVIALKLQELRGGFAEGFQTAANVAQEVSALVSEAISAVPHAALAWAGVCLCLNVLAGSAKANAAVRGGLSHVVSRMPYYTSLEKNISLLSSEHQGHFRDGILELYCDVLKFQLSCVRRFYRRSIQRFALDTIQSVVWSDMVSSIKAKETTLVSDAKSSEFSQLLSNSNNQTHGMDSMERHIRLLLDTQQEGLNLAHQQNDTSLKLLKLLLDQEESECLSTFHQMNYKDYKLPIPERIPNTCRWFLSQSEFQDWLEKKSSFLLVSAGPGCGKSVLSKFLLDEVLPETRAQVCYFFFKDGNGDSVSLNKALCSLIHQLLDAKPALIGHAMEKFRKSRENVVNSTTDLWSIFQSIALDDRSGDVICILDALDECEEEGLKTLQHLLREHFLKTRKESHLRFLFTSRPYDEITSGFQIQEGLRIPGEAEDLSGKISEEITLVIKERIRSINLDPKLARHLEERLTAVENRTYLWVYLVFDELKKIRFKRTTGGIDAALQELPTSVSDAYEKLLCRVKEEEEPRLRKALCIILSAQRPLTISEMNVAMEITPDTKSIDCESDDYFQERLQSWSGPFISIVGKKAYLLHQTAREFLLRKEGQNQVSQWQHSITGTEANLVLAEIVTTYITNLAVSVHNLESSAGETQPSRICKPPFQDYVVEHFDHHVLPPLHRIEGREERGADALEEALRPLEKFNSRIYGKILPILPSQLVPGNADYKLPPESYIPKWRELSQPEKDYMAIRRLHMLGVLCLFDHDSIRNRDAESICEFYEDTVRQDQREFRVRKGLSAALGILGPSSLVFEPSV